MAVDPVLMSLRTKVKKEDGARIRAVSEQSVKFMVACEDESQIVLTLADPGSSVTVRDANGKIEYLG